MALSLVCGEQSDALEVQPGRRTVRSALADAAPWQPSLESLSPLGLGAPRAMEGTLVTVVLRLHCAYFQ